MPSLDPGLIGGAATAMLAAIVGRAGQHANAVRTKHLPILSSDLALEAPLAISRAMIGDRSGSIPDPHGRSRSGVQRSCRISARMGLYWSDGRLRGTGGAKNPWRVVDPYDFPFNQPSCSRPYSSMSRRPLWVFPALLPQTAFAHKARAFNTPCRCQIFGINFDFEAANIPL